MNLNLKSILPLHVVLILSGCVHQPNQASYTYPPLSSAEFSNAVKLSAGEIKASPGYCKYAETEKLVAESDFLNCIYTNTDKELYIGQQVQYSYSIWDKNDRQIKSYIKIPFTEIESAIIVDGPNDKHQLQIFRKDNATKPIIAIDFYNDQFRGLDNSNSINSVFSMLISKGVSKSNSEKTYIEDSYYRNLQEIQFFNDVHDFQNRMERDRERDREWDKMRDTERSNSEYLKKLDQDMKRYSEQRQFADQLHGKPGE